MAASGGALSSVNVPLKTALLSLDHRLEHVLPLKVPYTGLLFGEWPGA